MRGGPAIDRRGFLLAGAAALAVATLPGCGWFSSRDPISTAGTVEFRNRMAVPPLAAPRREDGVSRFELVARPARSRIVPAGETETLGYNGPILGPTLRAERGERVAIDFRNEMSEVTTVHWHGMHLPAEADGGPHQVVEPGTTWSPSWEIDQPAATLWYHPHPHGETEAQVYRGLGGMFIVDDEEEAALRLPREYGVDDFPVIVQDKTFGDHGEMTETDRRDNGMLGDTILVNATAGPYVELKRRLTRLRLLNASTARSYALGIAGGRTLTMVASDGGLLPAPVELARVRLTPGERAEVLVEVAPGERLVLRSYPQDLGLSGGRAGSTGAEDSLDILELRASRQIEPSPSPPSELASITPIEEGDATEVREFELSNKRINGEQMDMDRIDEVVPAGGTEIWEVRNGHGQPHNFHVHGVQFQVLSVGDESPAPELGGWKDTVYVPPDVTIRLAMRFAPYADPATPYMYHCHLLWHEDEGMMGQFVVVDPDEEGDLVSFAACRLNPAGRGYANLG